MAKFREAVTATRHARENREAITRGLPRPQGTIPDPERFAQITAGIRDQLRGRGHRNHWHGGPDQCPVCGGVAPEWQRSREHRGHNAERCLTCRPTTMNGER
jgi:hypothetical protein